MNLKADSKMNLITNESRPMNINRFNELIEIEQRFQEKLDEMVKMEIAAYEEENKMLEGNIQLHRIFSIMMMCVVVILSVMLFFSNL